MQFSRENLALCGLCILLYSPLLIASEFGSLLIQAERYRTDDPKRVESLIVEMDDSIFTASVEERLRYYELRAHNLALKGKFSEALDVLDLIVDAPSEVGVKCDLLRIQILMIMGKYEDALKTLHAALESAELIDSPVLTFRIYDIASSLLGQVKAYDQALEYAGKAYQIATTLNEKRSLCHAQASISLINQLNDYAVEGKQSYQKQVEICAGIDETFRVTALSGLGWAEYRLGNCDTATLYYEQAIAGFKAVDYRLGEATSKSSLALCKIKASKFQEAKSLILESLPILEHNNAGDYLPDAYKALALIHEQNGDFESSLVMYKKSSIARDHLLDQEKSKRIALLQVQFDVAAQRDELSKLQHHNQMLELKAQSQSEKRRLLQFGVGAVTVICILLMMALHRLRNQSLQLRKLAQIDGLTGLHNRRHALMLAEQLYASCLRRNSPLAVVMVDLDLFKEINDRFGHAAGDEVLRNAARHFASCLRKQDVIGRTGGEEFAIFLPDTDLNAAITVVERCRNGLGEVQEGEQRRRVTASFGIAVAINDRFTLDELLQQADKALYNAKANGRNQVAIARDLAFAASAYDEPASLI